MSFEFIEHTADVRVRCRGASYAELLESAARALYAVTLTERRSKTDISRHVAVTGADREDLLIRWLQELIYLLEVERFVAFRFEFHTVKPTEIRVGLGGYACTAEERADEVKAATYHGMAISEDDGGLVADILFDL